MPIGYITHLPSSVNPVLLYRLDTIQKGAEDSFAPHPIPGRDGDAIPMAGLITSTIVRRT